MTPKYAKLLFDFDGTLVDSRQASIEATQKTFVEFGLSPPASANILHHMGIPIEQSFPLMGGASYPTRRHAELLNRFREIYGPICDVTTTIFDGIPEQLENFKAASIPLAIVTSKKSAVTLRTLSHIGLTHFFAVVVGSDHVVNYKPHPEPAMLAAERLQGASGHVLVIGDAASDIEMGKAAGFETCAVTWGAHTRPQLTNANPTHLIDAPDQLQSVIFE